MFYTYLIKCLPINKYYIGSKTGKNSNPETLWIDYFTSSQVIHCLIKEYGKHNFKTEIIETFDSEAEALIHEYDLIDYHNAVKSKFFLNKKNNALTNISKYDNPRLNRLYYRYR